MKIHPNDGVLEEFMLSLSREHSTLLEHLTRCSVCRARLSYLPRPAPAPSALGEAGEVHYDAIVDRVFGSIGALSLELMRERSEAPALFVALTEVSPGQRELLLRNSPRFHTWGLFELLVERSLEVTVRQPVYAEELARLALRQSEHLDTSRARLGLVEDLRSRAWAHLGNARRIRSDLQGAEQAFDLAAAHLEKGTHDPLEEAILLDLRASLLRDRRLYDEAAESLRQAIQIFLECGELHRAGRTLVNLSTVFNYSGRPERSIPLLYRALDLIDPEQEPRLLLCARHNLIFVLAELGNFQEARALYGEARQLYRQFPDAWSQNRRRWVKGKIARGLAQVGQAESLLLAARDGFVAEGIPYDTALVSLELASLYAEQGRAADLKALAAEMVPIFASRQIHPEALAALAFLSQAVEDERASRTVVAEVAAFLKRARHDPALRFEAPAADNPD